MSDELSAVIAALRATARRDALIEQMREKKHTIRDIATTVGLSPQRVSKILQRMDKVSK